MGDNTKSQIVAIDGTEYDANGFTDQQRMFLEHCFDLDRKIGSCKFQLDQLSVGKDAFLQMLKNSLQATPAEATPKE